MITLAPAERDFFKIVQAINQLIQGRNNAVGDVTLTPGVASTVVDAPNCGEASTPVLTPTTANAAAEIKNGTLFVSAVTNGSFTITHANNGQADRIFLWAAHG